MKNFIKQKLRSIVICLLAGFGCCASADAQSGSSQQPTKAQQVQQSGRQTQQSGSVSVQQTANSGSSSSVNTSTTTIQVQGNYTGSVPDPDAAHAPTALTLESAIQMGLHFNLGSVSASASLRQERALRLSALSELLPSLSASVSENAAKTDLQTIGLSSGIFGGGIALPSTVGPYHYYDARTTLNYNFLDFTARHNYLSAKAVERAAQLSERDARELVVLAVGGEYLRVLSTLALIESQQAQVQYAKSSFDLATAQLAAGTKSPVDAQKSQVEYQTEQQRLTSQQSDLEKQERDLARSIGLPQDARLSFAEKLAFTPTPPLPIDEALRRAFANRADLQSAQMQLRAAEESLKASRAERLPTGNVNGYLAVEGVNPNKGNGVFSGTASLSVPIFQGGRIKADERQAQAAIDQRRAEFEDQRGIVEHDVRNAYSDFQVATKQVRLAESNRALALSTLTQSQDRFAAGVTNEVEVVQSQESLAAADRDYISSLYSHNLAKLQIALAMGQAENAIPALLKGQGQQPPMTALEKKKPEIGKENYDAPERHGQSQEPESKPADPAKRRRNIVLAAVVLLAIVAGAVGWWLYSNTYESTDDAQIGGHLNPIASRVAGTVKAVYVEDNQHIEAGQPLLDLDTTDAEISLAQSQAQLAQAVAQLRGEQPNVPITATSNATDVANARGEVANAEAALASAEHDYQSNLAQLAQAEANNGKAQSDFQRYRQLIEKHEVAQSDYDQYAATAKAQAAAMRSQRSLVASAAKTIDQRKAQLDEERAKLDQSIANAPRQLLIKDASVQQRRASVESAAAQVRQDKMNLQYCHIVAPVSGLVAQRNAEVGARISIGQQLMLVVQTKNLWVTANFKETQLKKVRPGQRVEVEVDGLGKTFAGYVESMPSSTGDITSALPPENATGNYVKVVQRMPLRIRFKENQPGLNALRPGMSVVPKVYFK